MNNSIDFHLDTFKNDDSAELNFYSPLGHNFEIIISPNNTNTYNIYKHNSNTPTMTKTTFTDFQKAYSFFTSLH